MMGLFVAKCFATLIQQSGCKIGVNHVLYDESNAVGFTSISKCPFLNLNLEAIKPAPSGGNLLFCALILCICLNVKQRAEATASLLSICFMYWCMSTGGVCCAVYRHDPMGRFAAGALYLFPVSMMFNIT